ncbi:pilin [Francisella philomiragia]|uniref:pilin n=1 Tax=Francisella philomiragia TaxID=28110 RepID=UPI003516D5EB
MKNLKTKTQKGFSLVELMVVIAIIAILAAVAIPMYSNYTTRAKVGTEISKIGGLKAEVGELIANNNGTVTGSTSGSTFSNIPTGVSVNSNGAITVNVGSANSGSGVLGANTTGSLTLTPDTANGSIEWDCSATGADLSQSTVPSECTYA